jgi:small-conductance mechanosensitive channel
LAFEDFGADALNFSVDFWVELRPGIDQRLVASELRHPIAEALDTAGIVIAFPQRDVHLDTARRYPSSSCRRRRGWRRS